MSRRASATIRAHRGYMAFFSSSIARQLRKIVGRDAVLSEREDLMLYEYDGGVQRALPQAVVFPQTTEQVARIVKLAGKENVPIVPRGAGTGLSGGAIARNGGGNPGFSRGDKKPRRG